MLFHGLSQLDGVQVSDVGRLWYMYRSATIEEKRIHGGGFTLYGLLPDRCVSPEDRKRVRRKIHRREFDFIIFGQIHRCRSFLWSAMASYPANRLIFIDGEDHHRLIDPLIGRGLYFKRELNAGVEAEVNSHQKCWLHPIQFAIPAEKISPHRTQKKKHMAFIDPRDKATYIYKHECSYFQDYAESLFGVTMKKGGWDCLRHYEILANNCIPYFLDLQGCPPSTMVHFPKQALLAINATIAANGLAYFETPEGLREWRSTLAECRDALNNKLTTRALASYVLDTAASARSSPNSKSLVSVTHSAAVVHIRAFFLKVLQRMRLRD